MPFLDEPTQLCGIIGAVIYVGGFLLVQLRLICGNGDAFALSKVVAAGLVIVSLTDSFNLGSFLLQVSFCVIGVAGVVSRRITGKRARTRF